MKVWYGLSREALCSFPQAVKRLATAGGVRRVCEIGGGANPFLSVDFIARHNLEYTVVDISAEELAKAPEAYRKVHGDIAAPDLDIGGGFDFVFSQWCAEHVASGETMHRNVWRMLAEGGRALHLFPTLYSPPFVVNRITPEWLSACLLNWLQSNRQRDGNHGKFPAYYDWCRGPTPRQIQRLTRLGYVVEEYAGFFGHSGSVAFYSGYLNRVPPLCRLHKALSRLLVKRPVAALTSIAYVVLAKPRAVVRNSLQPVCTEPTAAVAV